MLRQDLQRSTLVVDGGQHNPERMVRPEAPHFPDQLTLKQKKESS